MYIPETRDPSVFVQYFVAYWCSMFSCNTSCVNFPSSGWFLFLRFLNGGVVARADSIGLWNVSPPPPPPPPKKFKKQFLACDSWESLHPKWKEIVNYFSWRETTWKLAVVLGLVWDIVHPRARHALAHERARAPWLPSRGQTNRGMSLARETFVNCPKTSGRLKPDAFGVVYHIWFQQSSWHSNGSRFMNEDKFHNIN